MKLRECDRMSIKGALVFILFLSISLFKTIPFIILGIDTTKLPAILTCIYTILIELVFIVAIFIMYKSYIISCWKDFKKNKNYYIKKYLKYWFAILIGTASLNLIINSLNNFNIANNENAVRTMLGENPLYIWITGVLLAPFVEELTFRLSLKSIFKSKWVFIIMSGLIFGSFHLFGSTSTLTEALYIFPYALPGCIFAYIYEDSDNIFVPIGMHFLHNGITMGIQIFLLIFGVGIV